MVVKTDNNKIDWTNPLTYATAQVPVDVRTSDPELVGKFVQSASQKFQIQEKPGKKKDQSMDLLSWYLLSQELESANDKTQADLSFAEKFADLVHKLGADNEVIDYNGQKITLGQFAKQFSASDVDFGGILGRANLPLGSPLAAGAINRAEQLAQKNGVLGAIQFAAKAVGVDYAYLLCVAKQESGFDRHAQASGSTARGLYQFLDKPWLGVVSQHRSTLEKAGIHVGSDSGSILALRDNALANALMGAEFTKDNQRILENSVHIAGFHAGRGDLYMAAFLGPARAAKFIEAVHSRPGTRIGDMFPDIVKANFNITDGGRASAAQVYARMSDHAVGISQAERHHAPALALS